MPPSKNHVATSSTSFQPQGVCIIGAGLMGHALAVVHANIGLTVTLIDSNPDQVNNAKALVRRVFETLVRAEELSPASAKENQDRISYTTDLSLALKSHNFIIEAVTEKVNVKEDLYKKIDETAAKNAVICSNTSYLNIFSLVPSRRLENSIITHWYTPPYIIDLIDIVPSNPSIPDLANSVCSFYRKHNKKPLFFKRFIPGYIANRLQSALNLEAFSLLENEQVTPDDIDQSIKHGLAFRLMLLGHMKKADFTGLEMVKNGLASGSYKPPKATTSSKVLDALVNSGHTGVQTGKGFYDYHGVSTHDLFTQRDLQLIELKRLSQRAFNGKGLDND